MDKEDPGLFGPDSVAWRLHADPTMLIAGLRALLLQTLYPQAIWGVTQNSDYRQDPWGRLTRTADYVATTVYGTRAEAERWGARVRGVHQRLSVHDHDSGTSSTIDEMSDALLWVHCAEIDSFVDAGLRIGLIDAEQADTYVDEQRSAAELVGLDRETVPASTTELRDHIDRVRPALRLTKEARDAASFILLPTVTRWWKQPLRPSWLPLSTLAFALLPRWARRMYWMPGLPTTDLTATMGLRTFRRATLAIPPGLRDGPQLKAARQRIHETNAGTEAEAA